MTRCSSATRRSASPAASGSRRCRSSTAPTRPAAVQAELLLNLLLGLGLGLLAGMARAIGLEFINDTIKSREDVRSKLALPCLGAVPQDAREGAFVEELKNPTSVDFRSLFGDRRGASIQHRSGNAQGPVADQHPLGRRQVVVRARACPEFRAAREVGAADRQRPAQARVQGGDATRSA